MCCIHSALFLARNSLHIWDTQCLKYVSGGDISKSRWVDFAGFEEQPSLIPHHKLLTPIQICVCGGLRAFLHCVNIEEAWSKRHTVFFNLLLLALQNYENDCICICSVCRSKLCTRLSLRSSQEAVVTRNNQRLKVSCINIHILYTSVNMYMALFTKSCDYLQNWVCLNRIVPIPEHMYNVLGTKSSVYLRFAETSKCFAYICVLCNHILHTMHTMRPGPNEVCI